MENNTTPTPTPEKKKFSLADSVKAFAGRFSKNEKKQVLKLVLMLAAVLFITNPSLIPFLPASITGPLTDAMSSMFGNVGQISSVISLNWVALFKLIVMVLLLQVLRVVSFALLNSMKPKTGRGKTILNLVLSTFNYMIVLLGIFWGMSIIGVDLATLFASLGIMALVIGFGAESLIADMVTGLFMIFENEYNVGDIIELGGYRGTVTEIGIRTTCVTDGGGNVKIINNSDMRNIVNLSNKASRAVCDFPVPYEVKIADAEAALDKVLNTVTEKYPDVFPAKPSYSGVQLLDASAVILRVVAEVDEGDRFTAARLLNRELKEGMEALGISCPYNQIVVHKAD